LDFFKNTGKPKFFESKRAHNFSDLDELILKTPTVFGFEMVHHKIIEEIWKNFVSKQVTPLKIPSRE